MARDRAEFERQKSQGAYAGWGGVEAWGDFLATGGPMQGGSGGSFQAPDYASYYNEANKKLEAYYARILDEEGGDVERAKLRLEEDYTKGMRISQEDYDRGMRISDEEYQASTAEHKLNVQQEDRALEGDLLSRGISQGGVAGQKTGEMKSRQDLRREAIDRALRQSEEELYYGKERGEEELSTDKLRGGEDTDTSWRKRQNELAEQRETKASQMAGSAYDREFQKRSAEKSFALQEESAGLAREQFDWQKDNA